MLCTVLNFDDILQATFQQIFVFALYRCFIPNAYGVLASVLAPVLLFLLAIGVVMAQAYQVTLQWKLYDDIFRGHHNIKGRQCCADAVVFYCS